MKIFFWVLTLSEHQIHLLRALKMQSGITVNVVMASEELVARKRQGWLKPDFADLNVTVVNKLSLMIGGVRLIRDNPDAIHLFGGMWASRKFFLFFLYAIFKRRFIGLIVEPYSDVKEGYFDDEIIFLGWLYKKIRPIIYSLSASAFSKKISLIFAISSKAAFQLEKCGFQNKTIFPFGYFIPNPSRKNEKIQHSTEGVLRIVFIGALISRKGIDFIRELAAVTYKRNMPIFIDVYGPGNPKSLINFSPNLIYRGKISFGHTHEVMADYDLLILPSKFDGWGVVVNEALQSGLPVLISDNAGASSMILECNAGVVFDINNIASLIGDIESILKDRQIINDWREKARTYSKKLTPEIAANYMLECIDAAKIGANKPQCPWFSLDKQKLIIKKKVVFFHRRPQKNYFSVEKTFQVLRDAMPADINSIVCESRFSSRGIIRRIYNIFEACFRQGDVNHITGDVHFLSYLLSRNKTLLTILDFIFIHNSVGIKRKLMLYLWGLIPEKRVRLISVISESTKKEALKYLKCSPNKIRVIPIPISPNFNRFDKKFNAENPTILQVGCAKNKNIIRLAYALQNIPCKLEIIGKLSKEQIYALRKNNVDYANSFNLTEEEMIIKYREADLVAFVSTYEGFGMPILEANAVGRAILTSNTSSMPEVAGNAACLVDPFSILEIRKGILRIIKDSNYREALISSGFVNTKRFEKSKIAEQYAQVYRELAQ